MRFFILIHFYLYCHNEEDWLFVKPLVINCRPVKIGWMQFCSVTCMRFAFYGTTETVFAQTHDYRLNGSGRLFKDLCSFVLKRACPTIDSVWISIRKLCNKNGVTVELRFEFCPLSAWMTNGSVRRHWTKSTIYQSSEPPVIDELSRQLLIATFIKK